MRSGRSFTSLSNLALVFVASSLSCVMAGSEAAVGLGIFSMAGLGMDVESATVVEESGDGTTS